MINQELIINGQRINLGLNFGVRLNRQLLNPAELNTKDAQFSYSIDLPAGGVNDVAFNYANIEETKNKFNRVYDAEYSVNGIRIFKGNFKLTSVKGNRYKGNLYVPVPKTIKDIFGAVNLNQNPPLLLPFEDFATSINQYNTDAAMAPQYAIFPYVLYGVLPKVPINKNTNFYSARTLWDSSVRTGIQDFAPAINPLKILKHIFNSRGYALEGTAFNDSRLVQLYQSYKNAPEYIQPWNYGRHAHMKITGLWSNWKNTRAAGAPQFEKGAYIGRDYMVDLFDATNTTVTVQNDAGGNITYKEVLDSSGRTWVNCQMRVPTSGYYKVKLGASIHVAMDADLPEYDSDTDIQYISGYSQLLRADMTANTFEVRLVRDNLKADFKIINGVTDGKFYTNNQPQNDVFDGNNIPKYFPQVDANGQVNFVDRAQDDNIVLGFSFGNNTTNSQTVNPRDSAGRWAQVLAAKPALSWQDAVNTVPPTRLAIKSAGWWKYGRIGDFDTEGENPNIFIDYSAGTRVTGKVLNASGNPTDPVPVGLTPRITGFYISALTGFQTPSSEDYNSTFFIPLDGVSNLRFTVEMLDPEGEDLAIVAYYDENMLFIGTGVSGAGSPTYTNEPLTPLAGAKYARFSGYTGFSNPEGITLTADEPSTENVILERFPLERYFTYVIEGGAGYTGTAFIHNGLETTPVARAFFDGSGKATFDTIRPELIDFDPVLTIYLKTPSFDVDGTLTIERRIDPESAEVIGWELSNKYKIDLINAPTNYAKRARYGGVDADANNNGQGEAAAVVWFDAGELLTIAVASSGGRWRNLFMHETSGFVRQNLLFDLELTPFRTDSAWLQVNAAGDGTGVMDWDDTPNFSTDDINLIGFLDAEMKTDAYIDNFCKAFNLRLSQVDAATYSLDVKQTKTAISSRFVNLDAIATVKDRENTPLGLPSIYKLGFTVDTEEQGYVESGDNGGGEYETGAVEGDVVEQKSTFSYNWFKNITKVEAGGDIVIPLPIISKSDVWQPSLPYPDAMRKRYTDLAYRFFYYDGLHNAAGATFAFNGASLSVARVSNMIANASILNYKRAPYTILDNYFTVLINGSSHYTELEGALTADMYDKLDGSLMAMFNGDLYYIAELGGYDPTGRNKTNIKLIRKI